MAPCMPFHVQWNPTILREQVFVAEATSPVMWSLSSLLDGNVCALSWPCQTFSTAGGGAGWNSSAGWIFEDVIELCAAVDLKILVLENVATVSEKQIYRDRLWVCARILLGDAAGACFSDSPQALSGGGSEGRYDTAQRPHRVARAQTHFLVQMRCLVP